ncbi:hypothetical protein BT96DRAFT_997346 [Gymnopus androsaceus JB14]|uniref:Uncharacterized protein n=1 Tax=Gymnopus androsaceus JB14 TaxID=1447944 RepID=A0A6A4HBU1_9AGAR|nr:hypothetical protein BT96DRAFT_997346 [Gymnopus androsaceus JB14]
MAISISARSIKPVSIEILHGDTGSTTGENKSGTNSSSNVELDIGYMGRTISIILPKAQGSSVDSAASNMDTTLVEQSLPVNTHTIKHTHVPSWPLKCSRKQLANEKIVSDDYVESTEIVETLPVELEQTVEKEHEVDGSKGIDTEEELKHINVVEVPTPQQSPLAPSLHSNTLKLALSMEIFQSSQWFERDENIICSMLAKKQKSKH